MHGIMDQLVDANIVGLLSALALTLVTNDKVTNVHQARHGGRSLGRRRNRIKQRFDLFHRLSASMVGSFSRWLSLVHIHTSIAKFHSSGVFSSTVGERAKFLPHTARPMADHSRMCHT